MAMTILRRQTSYFPSNPVSVNLEKLLRFPILYVNYPKLKRIWYVPRWAIVVARMVMNVGPLILLWTLRSNRTNPLQIPDNTFTWKQNYVYHRMVSWTCSTVIFPCWILHKCSSFSIWQRWDNFFRIIINETYQESRELQFYCKIYTSHSTCHSYRMPNIHVLTF